MFAFRLLRKILYFSHYFARRGPADFQKITVTVPTLVAKVDEGDKKYGLKGSLLSTTTLGAPVVTARSAACWCTSCSPNPFLDARRMKAVEVHYAPRASLTYLGVPAHLLTKRALVPAAASGTDCMTPVSAFPAATKRAKVKHAAGVIDLTGDSD